MAERRPNRTRGPEHDAFWDWCSQGQLRIQRCAACSHLTWPPAPECEKCTSPDLSWEAMSGAGKVVSWCTFERRYYAELGIPYDTILVELDEGALFISDPLGFGGHDLAQGLAVKVAFLDCEDDAGPFKLPVFERA
ncbi:MAG: Zn-ribbon domain-containing OB-fold protein [Acidimicrobiia bacterium]